MEERKLFKDIFNPLRILLITILLIVILLAGVFVYLFTGEAVPAENAVFGVTFSQKFAEEMGLDWQAAYLDILDGLGVKKLRLVAYWDKIEPSQGEYFFDDLDWQIARAEERDADVILVVGRKVPRWPECHSPEWADDLMVSEQQERILLMLEEIVNHYSESETIKAWQVENEPFLRGFGECPPLDKQFLDKEVALVRELNISGKTIIMTASGELSSWIQPALRGDVLGTTLYRNVWSDTFGRVEYPIPPVFYKKRADFVRFFTEIERVIVIELQAEPWSQTSIQETSAEEQAKSMDLEKFKDVIEYARQTGLDEFYLWGVEWWYQKKEQGNNAIWGEAKKLWQY
ncbi:beta-galactosidase [Patescibacteria group bacterium]|nr:beta-galactosidase [Patescibacteria group bacterium]